MQKKALSRALDRARLKTGDLDFILAGDLLNQCIGSAFSIRDFGIPFLWALRRLFHHGGIPGIGGDAD